ncbi:MAG: patatin-like phospholipase family protein, partial [Candidatus Obscuribacterales bacterium]|nr:patatin-like phospholipase family protein [Candidatus Obscuribacterales bacterium]
HLGFIRACEELSIGFTKITGVSIGSLVAAFYANGYSTTEIDEIFRKEVLALTPSRIVSALTLRNPLAGGKEIGFGIVGLHALNQKMVDSYGLKPRTNLRIIAYNIMKREPVVFQGSDYDLADALSASCAVPLVMRPIWYGQVSPIGFIDTLYKSLTGAASQGVLVDGGVHHPCPGEFSEGRAIISKLGFVSKRPREALGPVDYYFHALELMTRPVLTRMFPDPDEHLVIDVGLPDVAGLSFGVSAATCNAMIEHAYKVASRQLKKAQAACAL